MAKSYFSHFFTVMLVHALLLMGTWQLSQSEYARETLANLQSNALKIQIATNVMLPQPAPKKVAKSAPVLPQKKVVPATEPVAKEETPAIPAVQGTSADAVALYKAELRAMIERNKTYPLVAKRLGQTGTVVVAFTLLEDGHIIDVKIEKPSRYDNLNSSALEAVKKLERFKPLPKEFGDSKVVFKIPVNFITI